MISRKSKKEKTFFVFCWCCQGSDRRVIQASKIFSEMKQNQQNVMVLLMVNDDYLRFSDVTWKLVCFDFVLILICFDFFEKGNCMKLLVMAIVINTDDVMMKKRRK